MTTDQRLFSDKVFPLREMSFTPELFYEDGVVHLLSSFSHLHLSHCLVRQLFHHEIYLLNKDFYNEILNVR
jgi:hypothetical protein